MRPESKACDATDPARKTAARSTRARILPCARQMESFVICSGMCAHVRLQSNLGSGRFSRQHCTQKMAPQWRQWCLRTTSENFTLHPRHSSALASSSCAKMRIRMHVSAWRLGEVIKSRAGKRWLVDAAGAAERQCLTHSGAPLIFRTSSRTPLSRPLPLPLPPPPPPKPHPRGPPHAIALPTLAMLELRIDVARVTAGHWSTVLVS